MSKRILTRSAVTALAVAALTAAALTAGAFAAEAEEPAGQAETKPQKAEAETKAAQGEAAKTPSVDEIVNKANYVSYYQGADGRADVEMTIVDKAGGKQTRQMTILRWDKPPQNVPEKPADQQKRELDEAGCGQQKFYVFFRRPSDYNKMVFLVHKHLDKDDDRWLYMPALDNVKRIAGRDKRTSFVGSHWVYEDVSGRNITADRHELVSVSTHYYKLKSTPKKPEEVEFSYYEVWIMRSNFLPVQAVYYDKDGRKYRQMNVLKWDRVGKEKYPTAMMAKMADLKMGGHTVLRYGNVRYNVNLPENIFTERYLRRAPQEYLK
jgi:hypothetical protein